MLNQLLRYSIAMNNNSHTFEIIEQIVSFIKKNYAKPLTSDLLANYSGFNPTYFRHVFKQYTGTTPIDFLNLTRVEKSIEYLGKGHSIVETAAQVGFSDPLYFSKVFKKYKGKSPKAFKNNQLDFYF